MVNIGFTIVDDIDREITFDKPVTRPAVVNRYNLELLRACGLIDLVVGVDESIIKNSIYWPEFNEKYSFGDQQELNYEKIAELDPDVLIVPAMSYSEDLEKAMSAFNIPVVAVTGYSTDFTKQIDIIDKLFGDASKSQAMRDFYTEVSTTICNAVATIDEKDKKTVCWESIADYSVALTNNDWGKMVISLCVH